MPLGIAPDQGDTPESVDSTTVALEASEKLLADMQSHASESSPKSDEIEPELEKMDFDQFSKLRDEKRIVSVRQLEAVRTDTGEKVDLAAITVFADNGSTQQFKAFGQHARHILYLVRNNRTLLEAEIEEKKATYAKI